MSIRTAYPGIEVALPGTGGEHADGPGAAVPLMGPADRGDAVPLMGRADRGTAVPLMGPASPGTAAPVMCPRRSGA